MADRQLDLFAAGRIAAEDRPAAVSPATPVTDPAGLDDAALVAALPAAGLKLAPALAAEAGRRCLPDAVPALLALCRRFIGFGREVAVPEQFAALEALGRIGGRDAAEGVAALVVGRVVEGPNRTRAVTVAAALGARLPAAVVAALTHDPSPAVRAAACAAAGQQLVLVPRLLELIRDVEHPVRTAAACALGRLGRHEALPLLRQLLRDAPTEVVIEAAAAVADEDCAVLFARIARSRPELAEAALDALAVSDHPRAGQLLRSLPPSTGG